MARVTPITIKRELYADFRSDFGDNPVSQDLARKTNEEAVKESLRNLILTGKGERPFQPTLGGDIRNLLFENATPASIVTVKEMLREMINNYEPRVSLIGIDLTSTVDGVGINGRLDNNSIDIAITFNVINSDEAITLVQTISRVR